MAAVTIYRSIGDMTFDATFSEEHSSELSVTENPIETGALVSDHAFMKPLKVKVVAGVSDILTPTGNPEYGEGAGRAQTAFEMLCELQKSAEPFDVQTGLKVYENMVCESIQTAQDSQSASILYFTASLREVLIVETESTTYTAHPQAQKTKNKGEVQGNRTDNNQNDAETKRLNRQNNPNEGNRSVGKGLLNLATKVFGTTTAAQK